MTELQRSALLALAACLLSVGCVSTGGERGARDREIAAADLGRVPSAELGIENDQPIGIYLTELHGRMERWFLLRSSGTPDSARIRDVLEVEIQRFVQGREDELVFELAQGPVRNRVIAAAGLGFSTSEVALGPLLAALDDPELEVRRQALLGLGLLADPQAPTDELTTILRMDSDAGARHNACYALFRMVGQGARSPEIATAFRLALLDAEAAVRVQAARGLGVLVDGAAVDDLAAVLNDDVDLVSMAAARALRQIAEEDLTQRGPVARAMVTAWIDAEGGRKDRLRRDLVRLAGTDHGNRPEDWQRWSLGLP
ncbi:MAG: HEAT repeat domain-containing protein [Planctomycetota bacterium]|jgi:hypothetical protein